MFWVLFNINLVYIALAIALNANILSLNLLGLESNGLLLNGLGAAIAYAAFLLLINSLGLEKDKQVKASIVAGLIIVPVVYFGQALISSLLV